VLTAGRPKVPKSEQSVDHLKSLALPAPPVREQVRRIAPPALKKYRAAFADANVTVIVDATVAKPAAEPQSAVLVPVELMSVPTAAALSLPANVALSADCRVLT
jgi:hypothetical protein